MITFNLPLTQVDAAAVQTLIANGVREGCQLDYKETLPGESDRDKRDFLQDVSAFANAIGGDLIYGIRQRRDEDDRPTGEPDSAPGLPGIKRACCACALRT